MPSGIGDTCYIESASPRRAAKPPGTDKSVCATFCPARLHSPCEYRGPMWHRHSCLCLAAQPRVMGRTSTTEREEVGVAILPHGFYPAEHPRPWKDHWPTKSSPVAARHTLAQMDSPPPP